ncbi:MAG: hypothetical protein IPK16_30630 [Anaerolineales bacterium]|nr:hypothetical protein [Anaerolineales bacterium]
MIVVENAVNNLAYPLSHLHQLHGVKFAYWGHGRDHDIVAPRGYKALTEGLKLWLCTKANGFFAYTEGEKTYLASRGLPPAKIFVVDNTIDINIQRSQYQQLLPLKAEMKRRLGVENHKHVLLFVGRLTLNKRPDFSPGGIHYSEQTKQ